MMAARVAEAFERGAGDRRAAQGAREALHRVRKSGGGGGAMAAELDANRALEVNPRLRSAQLVVLIERVHAQLVARRGLADVRALCGEFSEQLRGARRRAFLQAFVEVVEEGEPLAFLAVSCLRWLALDARLRRGLIRDTACAEVLCGVCVSCAGAVARGGGGHRLLLLRGGLELLAELLRVEPEWAASDPGLARGAFLAAKVGGLTAGPALPEAVAAALRRDAAAVRDALP